MAAQMAKPQQSDTDALRDRWLGCMLGGATGDALGAPVEFMSHADIVRAFGAQGITDFAPAHGGLGRITDDTQMTLFAAEGLLRAGLRFDTRGICNPTGVIARAYRRWLITQGERPMPPSGGEPGAREELLVRLHQSLAQDGAKAQGDIRPPHCDDGDDGGAGWLFMQPQLHSRRAPGKTCLAALRAWDYPANNCSKGCGSVMRAAPIGLFCDAGAAFRLGAEQAAITHGHPTAQMAAAALACMIHRLRDGAALPEALDYAELQLQKAPPDESAEALGAIQEARELAAANLPELQGRHAIAALGQGWVAEEALAISVYCALVADDFRHGLCLAVNHDGDSDSTGAITGNLLGTIHGARAIPAQWLELLEVRDLITELTEDAIGMLVEDRAETYYRPNPTANLMESASEPTPYCMAKYPPW